MPSGLKGGKPMGPPNGIMPNGGTPNGAPNGGTNGGTPGGKPAPGGKAPGGGTNGGKPNGGGPPGGKPNGGGPLAPGKPNGGGMPASAAALSLSDAASFELFPFVISVIALDSESPPDTFSTCSCVITFTFTGLVHEVSRVRAL